MAKRTRKKRVPRRITFMHLSLSNDVKTAALTSYILLRNVLENQGLPDGTCLPLTEERVDELTMEWLQWYGRTHEMSEELEDYHLEHGRKIVSSDDWIELP